MTVDEAWRRIRSEEIAERLEVIEAEAKALRAELDTLQPKEVT
jgi:prefoldin subunit 5